MISIKRVATKMTHPVPLRARKMTISPSFTSKLTFTKIGSPSGLRQARFFTAIRGAMALRVESCPDTKKWSFSLTQSSFSRNGPDYRLVQLSML